MADEYICKQDAAGVIEKEMENYVSDIWYKSATHSALNDVNEDIKSLEPADVIPVKHGRWSFYDLGVFKGYICSECNRLMQFKGTFCPHCGAKMDGERKE